MLLNKKAQGLTIGTLIGIILGVVVLAFLIYGFSVGWGNLVRNLGGYTPGKSNVDNLVKWCKAACITKKSYDYCNKEKTIIYGKSVIGWDKSSNRNKKVTKSVATCYQIATNKVNGVDAKFPGVYVASCPEIKCK